MAHWQSLFPAALIVLIAGPMPADDSQPKTNANGVRIFSEVPPVGVHPRVLLSPADLKGWRQTVSKTYRGKPFFGKRYQSDRIDRLLALQADATDEELLAGYGYTDPGSNHHLLFATLDAVYHDDEERSRALATAVTNFARVVLARRADVSQWGEVRDNIGGIKGLRGIPAGLGHLWYRGGADFALAYDFLYDSMTAEQRRVCQVALSAATANLATWGMAFPEGRAISNWYGYHGELAVMLLAIEGEPGYRHEQWELFREMMRNFFFVHFYESGGSVEDGYTLNTALREGQFAMIAMARRGENLYDTPRFQNLWKWVVQSLVPGDPSGDTVSYSSARVSPYESAPVLARWAVPGNPLVNYYFWRYKGPEYKRQNRWQYAQMSTLFGMNWEDSDALPLDLAKLDLPLTTLFAPQGLFITRSDWSDDAAYLNVLTRQDAWYDRHENVDRGRFVFASHGRQWIVDRPWAEAPNSGDHSLVHIDGVSQAESNVGRGKAPNGRVIRHGDLGDSANDYPLMSYAVLDLKNAYDWLWSHSWNRPGEEWEPETRSFAELGWTFDRPGQPSALHGTDDPNAPRYNFQGCNIWRKPFNLVDYCWRTTTLVRGEHPYALIVDDVRKSASSNEEHTYEWYAPIPNDVEVTIDEAQNRVVLTDESPDGEPARSVVIQSIGDGDLAIRLDEYESGRRKDQIFTARRVVFSERAADGRFRMLLIPARGEVVVEVERTADGIRDLTLGTDVHRWSFEVGHDGRTRPAGLIGERSVAID